MANCSTIKVWQHYLIPLFLQPENVRDVAQPGSALAWGARGRWFESSRPDQRKEIVDRQSLFSFKRG